MPPYFSVRHCRRRASVKVLRQAFHRVSHRTLVPMRTAPPQLSPKPEVLRCLLISCTDKSDDRHTLAVHNNVNQTTDRYTRMNNMTNYQIVAWWRAPVLQQPHWKGKKKTNPPRVRKCPVLRNTDTQSQCRRLRQSTTATQCGIPTRDCESPPSPDPTAPARGNSRASCTPSATQHNTTHNKYFYRFLLIIRSQSASVLFLTYLCVRERREMAREEKRPHHQTTRRTP